MAEAASPIFNVRFHVDGSDEKLSARDAWFRDRDDYEWFMRNRPDGIVVTDIIECGVCTGAEAIEHARASVLCPIEEDHPQWIASNK